MERNKGKGNGNPRRIKGLQLSQKVIFMALIISFIIFSAMVTFSYISYKNDMIEDYGRRATDLAQSITVNIDGDEITHYDATGEKDNEYQSLIGYLSKMKSLTGVNYLYIMADTGTEYKYIAEGVVEGQTNISDLGDTDGYDDYGPEPLEVIASGTAKASEIYDGGEGYGNLISAFAPIKDSSGKSVGVLGIDLSAKTIEDKINGYLVTMLEILGVSIFITFILMYFFIQRIISRRIKKLTGAAGALAEGEVDLKLEDKSRDELGVLFGSFSIMARKIKDRAQAAERLAAGDLNIALETASEKDILAKSMNIMTVTLQGFSAELSRIIESTGSGEFSVRGDIEKFQGQYRKMVLGINDILATAEAAIAAGRSAAALAEKRNMYQTREVEKLNTGLRKLAQGELECSIEVAAMDSDTADIYEQFSNIKENLSLSVSAISGYIHEISAILSEMTAGNMTQRITSEYKGAFSELKDSINEIIGSLNGMLQRINYAADSVATGTKRIMENAAQANQLSLAAKEQAANGTVQMEQMLSSIEDINESSHNISKIIKAIDDIAFQTNILALNAAIEAGRAGIHGKGFAVVADEVRNLAVKSAGAAKETAELLEGMISKVEAGTSIANDTGKALGGITESVEKTAVLVEDIALEGNIASDEKLSKQAGMLKEMVSRFKLQ